MMYILTTLEFTKHNLDNHLLYMDDLKLYSKNEKKLDSLIYRAYEYLARTYEWNLALTNVQR